MALSAAPADWALICAINTIEGSKLGTCKKLVPSVARLKSDRRLPGSVVSWSTHAVRREVYCICRISYRVTRSVSYRYRVLRCFLIRYTTLWMCEREFGICWFCADKVIWTQSKTLLGIYGGLLKECNFVLPTLNTTSRFVSYNTKDGMTKFWKIC